MSYPRWILCSLLFGGCESQGDTAQSHAAITTTDAVEVAEVAPGVRLGQAQLRAAGKATELLLFVENRSKVALTWSSSNPPNISVAGRPLVFDDRSPHFTKTIVVPPGKHGQVSFLVRDVSLAESTVSFNGTRLKVVRP